MKYIKIIICMILVAIMFSGCSFRIASSVNDLISAVAPFGENADVKEALDSFVTNGYILKNPASGDFITSYNFYDIDNDDTDEAIAFYEPNDNLGTIRMVFMKQFDDKWKVVADIEGKGDDAYQLDFNDVDNDGEKDIIVCWNTISNSTSHSFAVYNLSYKNKNAEINQIGEDKLLNNYVIGDFRGDGSNQVLMFEINSGNKTSAKAELYTLSHSGYRLIGETKLDSRVITYRNISVEKLDGDLRVYADAIGSNGNSIITEVLYWSNMYDSIVSPFYSYSSGRTSGTSRNCLVNCNDIDNDGRIEIPTDKKVKKLPKSIKALDWKQYKNTVLIHRGYSYYVKNDGYNMFISDDLFDKIFVSYSNEERELTLVNNENKNEICRIKSVLKVEYDEKAYSDYSIVIDDSGYYYLAKCNANSGIEITLDQLKELIKTC